METKLVVRVATGSWKPLDKKRLQQVPGNLLTSALGKTSFKPVDQADRQLAIVACTVRVDLDQVEVGRSGDEPRPPPLATRGRGD